ncbi:MAG: endonuclease/exonuclease/phosphatase family protein [Chloroflexota bacterium]|nr:MAG: endonuclease/exonuclease/phosphatase family protein [Chloroflexota bacterium]
MANCDLDVSPDSNLVQNGAPDAVALWDASGALIDTVSYEGNTVAPYTEGSGVGLSDSSSLAEISIARFPDGADTDVNNVDLSRRCTTPGAANTAQSSDCVFIPTVPIPEIQGAGHISPYRGQTVKTEGIVTAVAFDGFFVQDPDGDGNDDTADGLWVFMGNFCNGCPDVGDEVLLTDRVDEFIPGGAGTGNLSTTDMAFPNIDVMSTGNELPDPVIIGRSGRIPPNVDVISEDELPVNLQDVAGFFNPDNDGIDFFESLEGMLVTVEDAVAVSAVRSFGSFSSELFVLASGGHPEVYAPQAIRTDRGGINLAAGADGYGDTNPERIQIQFDASDIRTGTLYPGRAPEINVSDRLGDVTGVVGYDFGNFEVRATVAFTDPISLLEPESTELEGTKKAVTVASYNVLNLTSPRAGQEVGRPDPDAAQRAKLAEQIVNNLGSPDVIALQEIQDNNGSVADYDPPFDEDDPDNPGNDGTTDATMTLQALVDAIAEAGGPDYDFFDVAPEDGSSGGVPGGNIRNAFLYNSSRVELDGYIALTTTNWVDVGADPDAFLGTRDPLAATFVFDGQPFTVINNHLSSRFGSTPIFGGPQPFFQAAEVDREAQVDALNKYVDSLLAEDKDARVIVLGDFNTFEFTNDLTEILPGAINGEKGIMKNLLSEVEDDNRYTFIFDGNSQVLDHMFATRSLLEGASYDIVHVNVDFARMRLSVTASDHEPLVGLFELGKK